MGSNEQTVVASDSFVHSKHLRKTHEMDISRLKNDAKLVLCRKYYYAGFAVLPFLWAINAVWFFRDAFRSPFFRGATGNSKICNKIRYWSYFLAGCIRGVDVFFQINRAAWGEL